MTFNAGNLIFVEEIFEQYKKDPLAVDETWRDYFQKQEKTYEGTFERPIETHLEISEDLTSKVHSLIEAYRIYGHLSAQINPIATHPTAEPWQLKLETHGLKPGDLQKSIFSATFFQGKSGSLNDLVQALKTTYCGKIGIEYMDSFNPAMEAWIQERIEPSRFNTNLTIEQKKVILQNLNKSELFEIFLHTKYPGQKRFSLEGGETLIPILEAIIEVGSSLGGSDYVIGMAHRGRLNVLSNIMNKSYVQIFSEFDENFIPNSFEGSGDVKYHKGFYSEALHVLGHKINITLTPNPSHLEAVDPVVEGQTKAKQILRNDARREEQIIPILVHGDAAIAGQGVVYETLQLSKLKGYETGGTLHIVVNNQIGFTTIPADARSTPYCTDIAKAFGSPVFHVNAEDPEGCFFVGLLAMELRQKFHCDVFIDLNCYRKYGHNEGDEPAFTQPLEYKMIRDKKSIREIYRDDLIQQGILEKQLAEALEEEFKKDLQTALTETKAKIEKEATKKAEEDYLPGKIEENPFQFVDTAVSKQVLEETAKKICTVPPNFIIHPKLENLIKERLNMLKAGPEAKPLDWGMAESLAYASILWDGKHIRLSGQDSCRGTFSHRHALWVDQKEEKSYIPLQHLKEKQGRFDLINSPLSEYATVGFEFGYSIANPHSLIIWEAQFGDFCNGAQVVIDQFITTAEQKWGQKSSLTLFLPHGYEGQGPEHSSARLERFLTLAGDNNIFIVNPTTPAQLFHLLRRQIMRGSPKPLIVFTPKGLLRHPQCVSPLIDLTQGSFQEILDDPNVPKKGNRMIFCSGRIYYDLLAMREKSQSSDLVIIRLEQLYPLHIEKIKALIKNYESVRQYFWIQEEPKNMGAWNFIFPLLSELLPAGSQLNYVGRPQSASPAVGSYALHKIESAAIMNVLFAEQKPSIFELAGNPKKNE